MHLNENAYPPPEACLDFSSVLLGVTLGQYERSGTSLLESKLAQIHGLSKDQLLIDNGSSEVIRNLFLALTNPGESVLLPSHGWGFYQKIADLQGLTVTHYEMVSDEAEQVYRFDLPQMKRLIVETSPAVIVIVSPNAFTGNLMSGSDLREILDTCRGDSIVIVDQAYTEFSYRDDISMAATLETYDHVIFTRTLSKFYSLANLRIGYAVSGQGLIDEVRPYFSVFGTSGVGQAIACRALEQLDYYQGLKERSDFVKRRFISRVNSLERFVAYHSEANFVLVRLRGIGPEAVRDRVRQEGMVISSGLNYGLVQHVRITVGDEETMERMLLVLACIDQEDELGGVKSRPTRVIPAKPSRS